MASGHVVEPRLGLDERRYRDRRVVHQPLSHPRDIGDNLDPEIAQISGWADARTQQMRRRMNRPRRYDDLAATLVHAELGFLALDQGLHADAARALETQLLDLGFGRDRQIVAQPRPGAKIPDRPRPRAVERFENRDGKIPPPNSPFLARNEGEAALFNCF